MECAYCFRSKKQMSGLEAPNGERVSICKSCCKKYFKCTLEQLEKINRRMLQSTKMELTAFIIIKATLWANEVFKMPKNRSSG